MNELRALLAVAGALWLSCSPGGGGREGSAVSEPLDLDAANAAIRELALEPDLFRRTSALADLLAALPADSADVAPALLLGPPPDLGSVESLLLVNFWALHEPAEAAKWALRSAPPTYRVAALSAAITAWARVAPEDVVKELGVTGAYANDPSILMSLVRGWLESGQPGLESYIYDLGPGIEQQRAIATLARTRIARDGAEATARWAEGALVGVDKFDLALFRQVGSELAAADPQAGVAWCDKHCEGPHGDAVRQLVATRWAANSAPDALRWLAESVNADPEQRQRALRAAFRMSLANDRETALAWLQSKTEAQRREAWLQPAIAMYVNAISWDRPEEAADWAALLENPEEQEQALIAVAHRWRDRDPVAAEAWLGKSALSEEAREKARTPPETGRETRRATGRRRPAS